MTDISNSVGLDNLQELEFIFNFYKQKRLEENEIKSLDDSFSSENSEMDCANNTNNAEEQLYYFLSDLRGFGGFPEVIEDEEFEKKQGISDGKSCLYHGFLKMEHGANYLWDYYYHYGDGFYGSGLYLTNDLEEAISYTKDNYRVSKDRVLKALISSDNYIDYCDLNNLEKCLFNRCLLGCEGSYVKILKDEGEYSSLEEKQEHLKLEQKRAFMFENLVNYLISNYEEKDRHELINVFASNPSILAVYLGFDYMKRKNYHVCDSDHIIVFNRKIVEVSKSDFRRFMDNAGKKYEGLSYNYEEKL